MPKGGARSRSGPAPDPNALRREKDGANDWTVLPSEGRTAPAPEWPLAGCCDREAELWELMWRKPQALVWERNGQHHEVALYVRRFVEAEERGSSVNLSTLVRQMGDSLGLTTPGMRSNRWKIASDEVEQKRGDKTAPKRSSSRSRFKVVAGGDES